ncbi:MAG: rRNA maturation RNase YbeY [Flavobacteriaceae bacterium]|nr:rRNA maturation RNase YbeY [Flavobacteriaceae bacterium]MDZ4147930.1 rRNA maturation RNase YbeY [Flavobacteriaceae bacterium]
MIRYNNNTPFTLSDKKSITNWLLAVIQSEGFVLGEIEYFFCSDEQLLDINRSNLNHDTYTDIITFDYTVSNLINADIFISIERVRDNANKFTIDFNEELRRVMVHGVLHLCGYKDKIKEHKLIMTQKEDEKLQMFHVKP